MCQRKTSTLWLSSMILILILIMYFILQYQPSVSDTTNIQQSWTSISSKPILFAIIMVTYQRKNGQSPSFIRRSLKSILAQTYSHWELFVTGDHYENITEFYTLFYPAIPHSKLFLNNLPQPGERGRVSDTALWECGGATAMNDALSRAEDRYSTWNNQTIILTHIDDDDTWHWNHLKELHDSYIRFPSAVFIWTKGYHCHTKNHGNPFPFLYTHEKIINNWPHRFGGNILHSAVSWRMNIFLRFRYRRTWDFAYTKEHSQAADYDLWERMKSYMTKHHYNFYHNNRATIEHLIGVSCIKNGTLWYVD